MPQKPFNLGTDPRGVFKGQGLSGEGAFEQVLSTRAEDIESNEALNPFKGGASTAENIGEYMDRSGVMGMLGSVTNVTGKGMPEILLRGVKTDPQGSKLAANWFGEVFRGAKGPSSKNEVHKELLSLPPTKISKLHSKLAEKGLKIKPTDLRLGRHVEKKALQIVEESHPKPLEVKKSGGTWTVMLEGRRMGSGSFTFKRNALKHKAELEKLHLDNVDKPVGYIEQLPNGKYFLNASGPELTDSGFLFVPGTDEALMNQLFMKPSTVGTLESVIDDILGTTIIKRLK